MTTPKTHLKRVQISGFKSIAFLDLKMNPINILIGANGSGKSNFISLFSFLRHLSEGKLQTYVEQHGFANTFFHFGAKKTKTISITLDVGDNTYHADFLHGEANDVEQKKGVSTFERLEEDQLQIWLEDYGMGDIWMKNLVGGRPEW